MSEAVDFFISYTAADERWAEWIAWQLEEAGESWKTKLQKWDFRAGNNFVVEMQGAAATAKHTVAVLSPAYFASRMTTAEWAASFGQDATGTARRLIPVRIADCTPPGLLAPIVYIDLFGKSETTALTTLIEGLKGGRTKPKTAPAFPGHQSVGPAVLRSAPAFPGSLPRIFAVPYPHNPYFKGRAAAMETLSSSLFGAGSGGLAQPQAVYGLGGVGKTQLAVEFAYAHTADYDAILWASADSGAILRSNMAALATTLHLLEHDAREEAVQLEAVERWLAANRRWLLIFDNADSLDAAEAVIAALPKLRTGHVIVTSRRGAWPIGVGEIPVDILDEQASVDMLLARAGDTESADDARAVATAVGHLPLALEQAAAYVRNRRIRFIDYLRDFKAARSRVLAHKLEGGTRYKGTVATTWMVTVSQLSAEARAILRLGSFLAAAPIPRTLWARGDSAFREAIARVAPGTPPADNVAEAADRGMVELADYSLARLTPDAIAFHRLVALVERDQLARPEREVWLTGALLLLSASDTGPPNDVRMWPDWEVLAPHVAEAVLEADAVGIAAPTSGLMRRLGVFLVSKARWYDAEPLIRRALAIDQVSLGTEHLDVATDLGDLATLLQETDRLDEAEPLHRRALAIDEACLGSTHPRVATDLTSLAFVLKETNRVSEAEPLLRRALAIDEACLGPDHHKVSADLNNLATILQSTDRFAEAEPLLRRALTIDEGCLGPNHPEVATRLSNLATLFEDTNRGAEAEPLFVRALAIAEASFGPNHPSVALHLNNLALYYRQTARPSKAERLLRRALAIDEASFGPDHTDVAIDLGNLAAVLMDIDKRAEAEPLLRRALAIDDASLGPNHPRIATHLTTLATLLKDTLAFPEAEALFRRALAIDDVSQGAHHPSTANRLYNLGNVLRDARRTADAEPILRRALIILIRFGSRTGHPHPGLSIVRATYRHILTELGFDDKAAVARVQSAELEANTPSPTSDSNAL